MSGGIGGLTCGTDEGLTFVGNGIPIPLEELDNDVCRRKMVRKDGGCGEALKRTFASSLPGSRRGQGERD